MESKTTTRNESCLARRVAPEDLQCGHFVGILNEVAEYPPFLWETDAYGPADPVPVQVRCRAEHGGIPLKVKAICLPFVFVKAPSGEHRVLDVRQSQMVRLGTEYARRVWKALKKAGSRQPPCVW